MVGRHHTAGRALGQAVDLLLPGALRPPRTSSLAKGNRSHLKKKKNFKKEEEANMEEEVNMEEEEMGRG